MVTNRAEMASSDAIKERRRQMSACRREYAALGIGKSPSSSATQHGRSGSRQKVGGNHFFAFVINRTGDRRSAVVRYLPPRVARRSLADTHRLLEGPADLRRLSVAVPKRLQAGLQQGIL